MCGWFCWERSSWPCNKHFVIEFACNTTGLCCSCYKIVRDLLQMDFVSTLKCTLSPFLAITLWDWKHKIALFSPSQFHSVSKMQKQPFLRLAKAAFGKSCQGLKKQCFPLFFPTADCLMTFLGCNRLSSKTIKSNTIHPKSSPRCLLTVLVCKHLPFFAWSV